MVKFPVYRKCSLIVDGIISVVVFLAICYWEVFPFTRFVILLYVMCFIVWIIHMYRELFKWKVTIIDEKGIHEEIYGLNFKEPKSCRTIILWDDVYEVEMIQPSLTWKYDRYYDPGFLRIHYYLKNRRTDYLIIYTKCTSLFRWKREKYDPKIFEELSKILNDRKIKFKF